jgi:hypothetical protein
MAMSNAQSLRTILEKLSKSVDMVGADDAQLERLRRIQSSELSIRTNLNDVKRLFSALNFLNEYLGRITEVNIERLTRPLGVVRTKNLGDLINWDSESLSELSDEMKTVRMELKNSVDAKWIEIRSEVRSVLALARILNDDDPSTFSAPIRQLEMYSSEAIDPDHMANGIGSLKVVKKLIEDNGADDEDVRQFLIDASTVGVVLSDLEKTSVMAWLTPKRRERFCIRIKNQ